MIKIYHKSYINKTKFLPVAEFTKGYWFYKYIFEGETPIEIIKVQVKYIKDNIMKNTINIVPKGFKSKIWYKTYLDIYNKTKDKYKNDFIYHCL